MSEVDWDEITGIEVDSVCYGKCIVNIKAGDLHIGILSGFILEIDGVSYQGNVERRENHIFLAHLSHESLESIKFNGDEVTIAFSKSCLTLKSDDSPWESYSVNYKGYNLYR